MHKVEEENERGVDETCVGVLWYEWSHVNLLPVSWEGSENRTEQGAPLYPCIAEQCCQGTDKGQARKRTSVPSYRTIDLQFLHAIHLKAGAVVASLRNEAMKSRCRFLKKSRYSQQLCVKVEITFHHRILVSRTTTVQHC